MYLLLDVDPKVLNAPRQIVCDKSFQQPNAAAIHALKHEIS